MSILGATDRLEQLYNEGCSYINTIYSQTYTSEMQIVLDTAYNVKKTMGD